MSCMSRCFIKCLLSIRHRQQLGYDGFVRHNPTVRREKHMDGTAPVTTRATLPPLPTFSHHPSFPLPPSCPLSPTPLFFLPFCHNLLQLDSPGKRNPQLSNWEWPVGVSWMPSPLWAVPSLGRQQQEASSCPTWLFLSFPSLLTFTLTTSALTASLIKKVLSSCHFPWLIFTEGVNKHWEEQRSCQNKGKGQIIRTRATEELVESQLEWSREDQMPGCHLVLKAASCSLKERKEKKRERMKERSSSFCIINTC